MDDAKGRGHLLDAIEPHEIIADEAVRIMHGLQSLLEQEYGNLTQSTFDGSKKVEIKVAELMEFGPEIEIARQLCIDCVTAWANGADEKVVAIIERAFNTDGGHYNRNDLLSLLRLNFDDEEWKLAQKALVKAIRIVGTKARIYLKERVGNEGKWETIIISLANS